MISEVSNRFDSYFSYKIQGTSPSGSFTIPAGVYLDGQVSFKNTATGVYACVEIRDSNGAAVLVLSAQAATGSGQWAASSYPVKISSGTYTIVTIAGNGNDSYLAATGILIRW